MKNKKKLKFSFNSSNINYKFNKELILKSKDKNNDNNKITACIISKNEEKNIENCLKSLLYIVDEIILLDTGSTDKTIEIASKYCSVYKTEWKDSFSLARNECISYAKCPWILSIDCDETIHINTIKHILYIKNSGKMNEYDIYEFRILNHIKEDIISEIYYAKLFKNYKNIKYNNDYGEFIEYNDFKVLRDPNLIINHKKLSDFEIKIKSEIYIEKILFLIKTKINIFNLENYYLEIGDYYFLLKKYDFSNIYYLKSLNIVNKYNISLKIELLKRISFNYAFKIKDINLALVYINELRLINRMNYSIPDFFESNDNRSINIFILEKYAYYKFYKEKKFNEVFSFYNYAVNHFYKANKSSSKPLKSYFINLLFDLARIMLLTNQIIESESIFSDIYSITNNELPLLYLLKIELISNRFVNILSLLSNHKNKSDKLDKIFKLLSNYDLINFKKKIVSLFIENNFLEEEVKDI